MTTRRKILLALTFVVAAVFALAVLDLLQVPRSVLLGYDRGMQQRYERITKGTTISTALRQLGEPLREDSTFNLPQQKGFEHHFQEAEESRATKYLLWINGMNWYYCIGFDEDGRAVIKGEGHS